MSVRSLDKNGDWTFGKGKNNYLYRNAAIVQNISTRLKSFLGNCFFALDSGIDWFNLLGSKNQLALELQVRTIIMGTAGVTRLVSSDVTLDHETRLISMRYTVETIYSQANAVPAVSSVTNYLLTEDGLILTTEDGRPIAAG